MQSWRTIRHDGRQRRIARKRDRGELCVVHPFWWWWYIYVTKLSSRTKNKTCQKADELSVGVNGQLSPVCNLLNIWCMANDAPGQAILIKWRDYASCKTSNGHLKQFASACCSEVRTYILYFQDVLLHGLEITKTLGDESIATDADGGCCKESSTWSGWFDIVDRTIARNSYLHVLISQQTSPF